MGSNPEYRSRLTGAILIGAMGSVIPLEELIIKFNGHAISYGKDVELKIDDNYLLLLGK